MADRRDTIVAIATPPGIGGVGVVRLSGPLSLSITESICRDVPPARVMAKREFRNQEGVIDQGLVVCYCAPRSYTGEDLTEFHAHGNPVILDMLVRRAVELGARQAEPGEFTRRAFLNDRISLLEAEAVADLITAGSEAAVRAANRSLAGEFSARIQELRVEMESLRVEVEASIDFGEEDIQLQNEARVLERLEDLRTSLANLINTASRGRVLAEGATVVIAGRPNAGKSSLMNRLTGHDASIVTSLPGTTRDLLRERVNLGGIPVTLVDTAGLRETAEEIEAEGVRRAREVTRQADVVLYLVDAMDKDAITAAPAEIAQLGRGAPTLLVYTKTDLGVSPDPRHLSLSAATGAGIDVLIEAVSRHLGSFSSEESVFSARRRHLEALAKADEHLCAALLQARQANSELFADDLRQAHEALGEITGKTSSDELLGRIFSSFCIGK